MNTDEIKISALICVHPVSKKPDGLNSLDHVTMRIDLRLDSLISQC